MTKKLLFVLISAFNLNISAQDKIGTAINLLEQNYSQEKVYLLTDKDQYIAGDTIWFKSYVFEGYNRTSISTTLFVELYDENKKIIDTKTIFLINGEGSGNIKLNNKLDENIYFIRAYTAYMANFDDSFQYLKPLPIYNPSSTKKIELNEQAKWTANAYPEGGTFIDGINTKFSVRLASEGLPPNDWSGYIIDTEKPNEKLAEFKGYDQNVGLFNLIPKFGKNYQAIISDLKQNKQIINLPPVANSGVSLHVNSNNDGIRFTLTTKNTEQGVKGYKVVGTINNRLAYRANINSTNTTVSSTIPSKINDDNNGILLLTIFNDKDEVVAQRLSFIKPNLFNITKPSLINSHIKQNARGFNSIDIEPDEDYQHYTVLVKEAPTTNTVDDQNIISALWLTGDFKNKIYSPAQYFYNHSKTEALDALLISEKWKRFDWKKIITGEKPLIKYLPEKNLSFIGKLAIGSRVLADTPLNIVFKNGDQDQSLSNFKTDANGLIYLDNIFFDEPLTAHYYLNAEKDKTSVPENLTLTFQPTVKPISYSGQFPNSYYKLVNKSSNNLPNNIARAVKTLENEKVFNEEAIQIAEVEIIGKKQDLKQELNEKLSSGMFKSHNETVFDLVNENQDSQGSQNILQWLQGRAAGLTFNRDQSGNLIPSIRGSQAKLYLDELPSDPGMISNLPVNQIAMVKVLRGAGIIGNAVLIYTKRGDLAKDNSPKDPIANNNKTIIKGYDKSEEYNPLQYNNDSAQKVTNDTREVLYWNPYLLQDMTLPPRIRFINNDDAKSFKITIISFDKKDNPLFYQEIIK